MNIDWVARSSKLRLSVANVINGHRREISGVSIAKRGPRDGALLTRFGAGCADDVDLAVASARTAFDDGRWSRRSLQYRQNVLQDLAALLDKHREELSLLDSLDVGKPISDALSFDAPFAGETIRHSTEAASHVYGKVYGVDSNSLSYELRRPIGVVAGIVGWNFPLVLAAQKIGPALVMGNCLVLKPSEFTSLSTWRVAELALEAGVPEGVLNVVNGDRHTGSALALHREVDLVTFTGSSATGKQLLIASGQSNMKRLILECGGKAPSIVFNDCDNIDAIADRVILRAFWNQGQVCTASSRLLIEDGVRDDLLAVIVKKMSQMNPGDPLLPDTKWGPLVSAVHVAKVTDYVSKGEQEGAEIIYRSNFQPPIPGGFYVGPTIFNKVSPNHRIAQEEIFGPVLSVIAFRDEEEAIKIANGTLYGLSAIIWTKDAARSHRMAYGIKSGWITVNATANPLGGPASGLMSVGGHKESGLGVEGGIDGLKAYTSQTAVQCFV
jgi:acyl-CoA reductase-like NAD-dependent aldehyde dehydrogenase